MWIQSLGQEDPLEELKTHSSVLAWESPRTEEPGGPQCMGLQSQTRLSTAHTQMYSQFTLCLKRCEITVCRYLNVRVLTHQGKPTMPKLLRKEKVP